MKAVISESYKFSTVFSALGTYYSEELQAQFTIVRQVLVLSNPQLLTAVVRNF